MRWFLKKTFNKEFGDKGDVRLEHHPGCQKCDGADEEGHCGVQR